MTVDHTALLGREYWLILSSPLPTTTTADITRTADAPTPPSVRQLLQRKTHSWPRAFGRSPPSNGASTRERYTYNSP